MLEYVKDHTPNAGTAKRYIRSLFPFWNWIFHYNLTWLLGDIIAGKQTTPAAVFVY